MAERVRNGKVLEKSRDEKKYEEKREGIISGAIHCDVLENKGIIGRCQ